MTEFGAEIIECGIDYITASASSPEGFDNFASLADRELRREKLGGNDFAHKTFEGYQGFKCGAVFAGVRDRTMLLRVSGHVANTVWREIAASSSNISRLDLQQTVRHSPAIPQLAERAEKDALKFLRARNRKTTVALLRDRHKGSTLYIGRRVSDRFARLYNKHTETGLEYYLGAWRYELELKREVARETARQLSSRSECEADISATVARHFRTNGIAAVEAIAGRPSCVSRLRCDSDATKRLRWLESSVAPTVKRLREHYSLEELRKVLGLDDE